MIRIVTFSSIMYAKTSTILVLLIAVNLSGSSAGDNNNAPQLVRHHDRQLVPKYHGLIIENTNSVHLKPRLYAIDGDTGREGKICGFEIYATRGPVPFQVTKVKSDGSASLTIVPGRTIDFEEKQEYEFDVAAFDCGAEPKYSHRVPVKIEVEDVNEFAPEFPQLTYEFNLHSGKISQSELLNIRADDGDASPVYKDIRRYDIISRGSVPFSIDRSGTLFPTRELDVKTAKRFEFDVIAEDYGGMRSSKPARVVINVLPPCSDRITGVPDSIFYHALGGRSLLFPNISYTFCAPTTKCSKVKSVSATVSLGPKDITFNTDQPHCSLDNVTLTARRKYCNIAKNTVLLKMKDIPEVDQEANYPPNDAVVSFDGITQPIPVDTSLLLNNKQTQVGFGSNFVVHFWMRRIGNSNEKYPSRQHILCYENSTVTNVDVAARGCSLLLDVAFNRGSIYFWNWNVPQLCDGTWHHYAISVNANNGKNGSPEVNLYIDGLVETNPPSGPGVADFVSDASTRNEPAIRIGGCPTMPLSEFLIAELADINVLIGQQESLQALRCLSDCREFLSLRDMRDLKPEMMMSFNADNTQLIVSGPNVDDVLKVIRDVQYSNTHLLPAYGERPVTIDIKAECSSGEFNVPRLETAVSVSLPYDVSLLVGNLDQVTIDSGRFTKPGNGVRIFPKLSLSAKLDFGHSGLPPDPQLTDDIVQMLVHRELSTLTECVVTLDRNSDHSYAEALRNEHLVAPMQLADKYGLDVESDPSGQLLVRGAKRAAVYQKFLRQVEYTVEPTQMLFTKPRIIRRFSLTCAYDDARVLTATYNVDLTLKASHGVFEVSRGGNHESLTDRFSGKAANVAAFVEAGSAAGIGIALLILVAVALIVIAVVIIVCRRRPSQGSRRRFGNGRQRLLANGKHPDDMEWDNSGFNVVVNPLSGGEDGEDVIHDSSSTKSSVHDTYVVKENAAFEPDEEYLDEDDDYESESDLDEEAAFTGGRAGRLLTSPRAHSSPTNRKVIPVPTALVDDEPGHDVL